MLYGYLSVGESRRRGRTVRTAGESRLAARKVLKLELRCGSGGKASDWWRNAGDPPPRGTCPFRGNQTTGGALPRPRKCENTVLGGALSRLARDLKRGRPSVCQVRR